MTGMNAKSYPISAVVCSYNRKGYLPSCLDALAGQDFDEPYEVIVVDDGSTDGTSEAVREWTSRYTGRADVRLVTHEKNKGLGAARNTAVEHSRAGLIAFTDDDTVVRADWVTNIVRIFREHPEVSAVGGPVLNGYTESHVAEIGQQIVTSRLEQSASDGGYTRFLVGNNQSYRKAAVQAVGGFEEGLIYGGEEAEIQLRLVEQGHRLMFSRGVVVTHYQRNSVRSLMKQYYRYGINLDTTRRRHLAAGGKDLTGGASESWATRVWRVVTQPRDVARHLHHPAQKLLCYPLVWLSSLSRMAGFLASKIRPVA